MVKDVRGNDRKRKRSSTGGAGWLVITTKSGKRAKGTSYSPMGAGWERRNSVAEGGKSHEKNQPENR